MAGRAQPERVDEADEIHQLKDEGEEDQASCIDRATLSEDDYANLSVDLNET